MPSNSRKRIALLSMMALILLTVGVWFLREQTRHMRRVVEANLESVARLKADEISKWRTERLTDAYAISESAFFNEEVAAWMADPSDEVRDWLLDRFRGWKKRYGFRDILLADARGVVRLSLNRKEGPFSEETEEGWGLAFQAKRPILTELHEDRGTPGRHIDAIAPIFLKEGNDGNPLGAIVLETDAAQYLDPLLQNWPTPSRTAESMLIRREGDSVLFLNELRHVKGAALKLRTPLSREDAPVVMAVTGREGVVQGRDYRKVPVLAILKAIPNSNWFIVAKMDEEEAFAAWRLNFALLLSLTLALTAAGAAAAGLALQRNGKAHYRELYRAEADLRKSEAINRGLVERLPHRIFVKDRNSTYLTCNASYAADLGLSPEEIVGKDDFAFFPADLAESYRADDRAVMEQGTPKDIEERYLVGGKERRLHTVKVPYRDEEGRVVGVLGIFEDVTERKRAEQDLREKERLLSESQHLAGLGSWAADIPEGKVQWSEELRRIFGLSQEEPLPSVEGTIGLIHPDDRSAVREWIDAFRGGNKAPDLECRVVRPDGEKRHVQGSGDFLRDATGRPVRAVGTVQDVTERKRSEEEREKLRVQLTQAQKMESVGRLAGGVAHDFNNMLGVILGYAEMLRERPGLSNEDKGLFDEILSAAERSVDLTRQLLAFARKQTISPAVLDLNDAVSRMIKMIRRLIGEDIHLSWAPGHELWKVKVDPSQVDQVLANLAINARDAIAGVGRLDIETANATVSAADCVGKPEFAPGEYVRLTVRDDGCGMSADVLERVFEPFFTTKEIGKGTGLGLSTVYGIVKQNNGLIQANSEPGNGAAFEIYLPRHEAEPSEIERGDEAGPPRGGTETVLLVEDEERVLEFSKKILEKLGYSVLAANSPEEALRLADRHEGVIHLLLTDVVMPQMNGRELAVRLASIRPEMKRLFMSGYTADKLSPHGVLEEGVLLLQKPFSIREFANKVRAVLDRSDACAAVS